MVLDIVSINKIFFP